MRRLSRGVFECERCGDFPDFRIVRAAQPSAEGTIADAQPSASTASTTS
jgi:hypothetical protein